jgi:WD40 repeat protein
LCAFTLVSLALFAQDVPPELVVQTGHSASVDALAFTGDGRWLVSSGHDDSVRLWDLSNGRQVRILGMHMREVETLAVCPVGSCVVSGGNDQVLKIWEIPSGRLIQTFVGHTAGVKTAIFSKDGRQLISGSGDPPNHEGREPDFSIRVWDVATGREVRKFEDHRNIVSSLDISRDGKTLLSGSYDGTLKLWDYATGRLLRTIEGQNGDIRGYFSADGSQIFSLNRGQVELWDFASGRDLGVIARGATSHHMALNPNNSQLAFTNDHKVEVVNFKDHAPDVATERAADLIESIAFSQDGKTLAYGQRSGAIAIVGTDRMRNLRRLSGYAANNLSMAVSPNGSWIASGDDAASVKLWNTQTGCLAFTLNTESNQINALAFSPDNKLLASSGVKYGSLHETPVELWDVASGQKVLRISDPTETVDFLRFSPYGRWLGIGARAGSVMIWDLQRGAEARTLSPANKAVAFSSQGNWVATGGMDNALTFWELPSGRITGKYSDIDWGFEVSQDGRWLASTGRDKNFKVWDTASLAKASQLQTPPGTVVLLGIRSRRRVHTFQGHRDFVSDVTFSHDGKVLATSSWDGDVKLWSTEQGREISTLRGHTSRVVSVAFSPNDQHVYSASADGTVRLWNVASGQQEIALIAGHDRDSWLAVSPDGLFDGTWNGMKQVAWRDSVTGDTVPVDRFFSDFYYPGLLTAITNGNHPHAEFDIGVAVQIPALRSMLRERLAHIEQKAGQVVVCFEQIPGAAMRIGPDEERSTSASINGYQTGTEVSCKFQKALRTSNSATTLRLLQNLPTEPVPTESNGELSDTSHSTLHVQVIGISNYQSDSGLPNVAFAVPSAKAIEQVFKTRQYSHTNPYSSVRIWEGLYDSIATRDNLRNRFAEMAAEVKPDDVVFIYLAGHGRVPLGEEMFYFVPFDGRDPELGAGESDLLRSTAVSTAMLAEALRDIPARRIIFVLDACQSGGAIEALSKIGTVKAQAEQRRNLDSKQQVGVFLVAATLPLSYAVGLKDKPSVLADTMLRDFNQTPGTLSARQISSFIKENLPRISYEATQGFRQTPLIWSIGRDFAVLAREIGKGAPAPMN